MKILKNIVVGLIIFSMFLFCGPSFAAQDYGYAKIDKALIGKTGTVNVIIITGDKTVVDYVGILSYSNKFFQGTIESCINNSVESVYLRCKSISPDLTKRWVFNTVINGFSCEVDASKLIDLAKLPSVKKIVDATFRYEMQINKHLPYLGVTKLRQIGTPDGKKATGAGIRVGVIDSGINYKHLALGDGWGRRVKFGYDFADKDSDPLDFMGHGSHCAGIIGANGKYLDTPITGVAPEATFGAYKVFTVDEGGARPDNVAAALEMAAKDKCAVANMSLGRALYYGGENAVEDEAIKNATKAGMLVVVAAGNDGYRSDRLPLPIGVPAVTEEALCVAATDERGKCLIEVMTKTGETKKMLANNHIWGLPSINPDDALYEVVDGGTDANKIPDCAGKVLLIQYKDNVRSWHRLETQSFIRKLKTLKCKAFIFWSDGFDGTPFTLSYFESFEDAMTFPVPIYTLNRRDAKILLDAVKEGQKIHFKRISYPGDFSSTGPYLGPRGLKFKPEVSAPGMWIFSTVYDEKNPKDAWDSYSGTSMAAPFVTGMSALVKSYHPDWLPWQIKASLMNTAKFQINPLNGDPYPLVIQGSGLANVYDACTTPVITDPPAFTFHGGNYKDGVKINLVNVDLKRATVKFTSKVTFVGDVEGVGISITQSDEVVSPPPQSSPRDATASLDLKITLDKQKVPKNRVVEGSIEITIDNSTQIHVPFMALFGEIEIYNSLKSFSNLLVQNDKIDVAQGEKPGTVKFHVGAGSKSFFWGNQYDNFAYMTRISVLDKILDRWRDIYEGNYLIPGDYEFEWDGKDIDGELFLPNGPNGLGSFMYYEAIVGSMQNKLVESSVPRDAQAWVEVIGSDKLPLPELNLSVNPEFGALNKTLTVKMSLARSSQNKVIRFSLLYDAKMVTYTGQYRRGSMTEDSTSIMISIEDNQDGKMTVEISPSYAGLTLDGTGDLMEIDFTCNRVGGTEFDTSFVEILDNEIKNIRFVRPLPVEVLITERYLLIGDFNVDWVVDDKDLVIFGQQFGKKEGDPDYNKLCDINRDKVIDEKDFIYFSKHFGERSEKPK